MITALRIAITALLIHLLETCLLWPLLSPIALLDLLLLYVAFVASPRGALRGGAIGFAIGFFRGMVGAGFAGTEALAFGAAAAFAGWAYRKLVGETTFGFFLILFGTVLVHDLVRGLAALSQGITPLLFSFLLRTLPAGIITGLVGAGALFLRRGRWAPEEVEA
jgi:cell shape-determining protein MreD